MIAVVLQTYTYKGKLIGRFFDEQGAATAALQSVHERAKEGERLKAERAEEEKNWPSCNTKWTQEEGASSRVSLLGCVRACRSAICEGLRRVGCPVGCHTVTLTNIQNGWGSGGAELYGGQKRYANALTNIVLTLH